MTTQAPETLEFQTEAAALQWAQRFPAWRVHLEYRGRPGPEFPQRIYVAEGWPHDH